MEISNTVILILASFFMGLLPIVFLWVNNLSSVTPRQMIKILGMFSLGYVLGCGILQYFIRDFYSTSLILIVVFYIIFFGKLAFKSKKLCCINLAALAVFAGLFFVSQEKLQWIFNIFLGLELFIGIVFTYHIARYFHTIRTFQPLSSENEEKTDDNGEKTISHKHPYSVYFIVPDEYAGFNALAEIGIDNSEFKNWLQNKGFYIAEDAKSNYNLTQNSICSTLNMDYVQNFFTPNPKLDAQSNRTLFLYYIFNNKVGKKFQQLGYKYYHIINNWESQGNNFSDCADYPINIMDSLDFEGTLFCRTFFEEAVNRFQTKFYRLTNLKILDELSEISKKPDLKFVYSHMLCPHAPYGFDENGNLPESYFNNCSQYFGKEKDDSKIAEEYVKMYDGQVKYLNKKLMEGIEDIKKNDPKSIIIIQGDHGTHYYGYKEKATSQKPSKALLKHRYSPLRVIYAPADFNFEFESSVNVFKAVFNYITGSDEEFLEDKYYYSLNEYFDFREISKFFLK